MRDIASIKVIVQEALSSASVLYLEQVIAHGIHNITNDYHGQSEDDYNDFYEEFKRQAQDLLNN